MCEHASCKGSVCLWLVLHGFVGFFGVQVVVFGRFSGVVVCFSYVFCPVLGI